MAGPAAGSLAGVIADKFHSADYPGSSPDEWPSHADDHADGAFIPRPGPLIAAATMHAVPNSRRRSSNSVEP